MNEQRDWHDLKLQQLQDDNSRLRAELAAEKERAAGIAEILSLREELAAETRRAEVFLEEKLWNIATEKERCAKIADVIAEEGKLTTCYWRLRKVAAAIRASNTAPPQPCSYPQYCGREVCNCPRDAAPPHVEPSAAESEEVDAINTGNTKMTQTVDEIMNEHVVECEADQPMAVLIAEIRRYRATEARMLELARVVDDWANYDSIAIPWDAAHKLAALVIAFGEKK